MRSIVFHLFLSLGRLRNVATFANRPAPGKANWQGVTFESNVGESTKPISIQVQGTPLVIWKANGNIFCADDICPHRGAALSQGRLTPDGGLECAYHGWLWEKPSCPARIPQLEPGTASPRRSCLRSHTVEVRQGIVWVWMGENFVPTHEPPAFAPIDQHDSAISTLLPESHYDFHCNPQLLIENVLDPAHIHIVHDGEHGLSRDTAGPISFKIDQMSPEGFHGRCSHGKHWTSVRFIAPGFIEYNIDTGSGMRIVQQHVITPLSDDNSTSTVRFMARAYMIRAPRLLSMFLACRPKWLANREFNRVCDQDAAMLMSQHANIFESDRHSFKKDALLKSSDGFILAYRKWLAKSRMASEDLTLSAKLSPTTMGVLARSESRQHATTSLPILSFLTTPLLNSQALMARLTRTQHSIQTVSLKAKKWWGNGTDVHKVNCLANAAIFSAFWFHNRSKSSINLACKLALINNYAGQLFDNGVRALGTKLGDSLLLRILSKVSLMLHGFGVPMISIPITEIASRNGLFRHSPHAKTGLLTVGFVLSFFELIKWGLFDSREMKLVDKTKDTGNHSGQQMNGTLSYTSGKLVQCLLPVFTVLVYQIGISSVMVISKRGTTSGALLLLSALMTLVVSALNRPGVQLCSETLSFVSLYTILVAGM